MRRAGLLLLLLSALMLLAPPSPTWICTALGSPAGQEAPMSAHVAVKSAGLHSSSLPPPAPAILASTPTSPASPRSSDTAAARAGAEHNTAATDALFFFAFMLLIGIFTVHVLAFTRVPYTALLLVSLRKKRKEREEERTKESGVK